MVTGTRLGSLDFVPSVAPSLPSLATRTSCGQETANSTQSG
jgi:hypothetical protein